MDCKEVQRLIVPFIEDKLPDEELEEFLNHINNCKDCKEEYDVYFALLTGMKWLGSEKERDPDFIVNSNRKLKDREEYLVRKKMKGIRTRMLLALCIGMFVIWMGQ